MYLSYRAANLGDLDDCFPLIADNFAFCGQNRDCLLGFWRRILGEKAGIGWVVEDYQRSPGRRIVAFGLTLFLEEGFSQEVKTAHLPYVSRQVLQRWRRGTRVFLDLPEIAHHNEKGSLNLLVLHTGLAHSRLTRLEALQVRFKLPESFLAFHRGYRIKEFLKEVYGPEEKASMTQFGFKLRRDYTGWALEKGFTSPPGHPYLFGITREEGQFNEQNYAMAQLFNCPTARFHFSPGEKDVLQQALLGETDENIADSLRLSPWTVKKRWQEIYAKVEEQDPLLLSPEKACLEGGAKRRPGKRRPDLMEYLRCHPEEIRPSPSPSHAHKGGRPRKQPLTPPAVFPNPEPAPLKSLDPTLAGHEELQQEVSA
jgi:DNA-binding CsgD family transcriptional regulator